jgi:hypothetical protein
VLELERALEVRHPQRDVVQVDDVDGHAPESGSADKLPRLVRPL